MPLVAGLLRWSRADGFGGGLGLLADIFGDGGAAQELFDGGEVLLLADGRILVVEYKGAHLINDPLTKQKDNVGALWEAKSKGKGLFLMAERVKEGLSVSEQVRRKITSSN